MRVLRVSLPVLVLTVAAPAFGFSQQDAKECVNPDPKRRIAGCTRVLEDTSASAAVRLAAYNNRGAAYRETGDYERTIADSGQAIKLDPKSAAAYTNRGNAYVVKGDLDRAIADFSEAIRLNPRLAAAYLGRGVVYSAKNDKARAIADLKKAAELGHPKAKEALRNRGVAP